MVIALTGAVRADSAEAGVAELEDWTATTMSGTAARARIRSTVSSDLKADSLTSPTFRRSVFRRRACPSRATPMTTAILAAVLAA